MNTITIYGLSNAVLTLECVCVYYIGKCYQYNVLVGWCMCVVIVRVCYALCSFCIQICP